MKMSGKTTITRSDSKSSNGKHGKRQTFGILFASISAIIITGVVFSAEAQSAGEVNPYPATPEEIEAYKEFLIEQQLTRMGRPEREKPAARRKEPVKISSLQELAEYSGKSGATVKMEPGTYEVTLDNFTEFLDTATITKFRHNRIGPLEERVAATLFNFSGRHSLFDLSGVTIKIDTRILNRFEEPLGLDNSGRRASLDRFSQTSGVIKDQHWGDYGIEQVMVSGHHLFIRGLTIENVHEIRSKEPEPKIKIEDVKASHRTFAAYRTYDGNPKTSWRARAAEPWIEYRFNQPATVSTLSIQTREGRREGRILPFEIQVPLEDGAGWQTVYEGRTTGTGELEPHTFKEVQTDRIRIVSRAGETEETSIAQIRVEGFPWPNAYPESDGHHATRTTRTLHVTGTGNLLQGITVTSRGSRPYGYGSELGKGPGPLTPTNKHSTLAPGDNNVFIDCKIYARSFGHAVAWGQNNTLTFIDCLIEGEIRSTNEILKETSGPAHEVDFERFSPSGDKKIEPGTVIPLNEDAFRSYGHTQLKGNVPGRIKILGCTVKRVRSGAALGYTYLGDVFISNTTLRENAGRGFYVPSNSRIVNSKGDFRYAPVLDIYRNNIQADITFLSSLVPDNITRHMSAGQIPLGEEYPLQAARIAGNDHTIRLRAEEGLEVDRNMVIIIGQAFRGLGARNVFLRNETGLPIILSEDTQDCVIVTDGEVIDKGRNNEIRSLTE